MTLSGCTPLVRIVSARATDALHRLRRTDRIGTGIRHTSRHTHALVARHTRLLTQKIGAACSNRGWLLHVSRVAGALAVTGSIMTATMVGGSMPNAMSDSHSPAAPDTSISAMSPISSEEADALQRLSTLIPEQVLLAAPKPLSFEQANLPLLPIYAPAPAPAIPPGLLPIIVGNPPSDFSLLPPSFEPPTSTEYPPPMPPGATPVVSPSQPVPEPSALLGVGTALLLLCLLRADALRHPAVAMRKQMLRGELGAAPRRVPDFVPEPPATHGSFR